MSEQEWSANREFRPKDEGYTDDLLTRHALEFIRASKQSPFFCYIPFQIAHAPIQAKESDLAKVDPQMAANVPTAGSNVTNQEKHIHAAMLTALDNNVATIQAELSKLGLLENTIFVFTSDNGAMQAGNSLPLRGHKHTIYDGGVRLPTVMHWPKGGLVGGKKWPGLCGALDMFPTLMAMTESKMPETRALDGKNIFAFSPATPKRHPYYSPLEGNNSKPFGPLFKPGNAIDHHGRDQSTGPGIADGKSVWEHRIIGLAGSAPGPLGKHGVVFTGGQPGTYTIYLDNLRLRHADGSATVLWANKKDTRLQKTAETEFFKDVKVRAVDLGSLGR